MSSDRIRLIRTGHTEVGDGTCGLDGDEWPCDTAVVLLAYMNDLRDLLPKSEQLAAAESRADQLELANAALREAVDPLAEFAAATMAIDALYASGHPIMTPEMARQWPGVCERAQAALAAILAVAEGTASDGV